MSISLDDVAIYGRKTFFIAPSESFLPESYLESYLAHGYECYRVQSDFTCPLKKKIAILVSEFPGALLFFDTTANVEGIDWRTYLQELQRQSGAVVDIGIFYDKAQPREEKDKLKAFYTNTVRIRGGCVGLEKGAARNFERIDRALKKCKAGGRRTTARVGCDADSTIAFAYQAQTYRGRLIDMSITHFACEIEYAARSIPIYEKLHDASFVVNGLHFASDIVLILRRVRPDAALCIFMFIEKNGLAGLEEDVFDQLCPKMYEMVTSKNRALLQDKFRKGAV